RTIATLRRWEDKYSKIEYAYVSMEGAGQRYKRETRPERGSEREKVVRGWEPDGDPDNLDGGLTTSAFERMTGMGVSEPHIDVIDRINHGKRERRVTTAMQAFRQRAVKGDLPSEDEDGNEIDWGKVFEPAPGALWDLPEGVDIWESSPTDIRSMLDGEKT